MVVLEKGVVKREIQLLLTLLILCLPIHPQHIHSKVHPLRPLHIVVVMLIHVTKLLQNIRAFPIMTFHTYK